MKTKFFIFLFLTLTTQEIYKEIAWECLHTVDYFQTMQISKHPEDFYEEYNPFIGEHPSEKGVSIWFLSTAILHPFISNYLPEKIRFYIFEIRPRELFQNSSIIVSSSLIINNIEIGIRF
jgi:hypothetical protein